MDRFLFFKFKKKKKRLDWFLNESCLIADFNHDVIQQPGNLDLNTFCVRFAPIFFKLLFLVSRKTDSHWLITTGWQLLKYVDLQLNIASAPNMVLALLFLFWPTRKAHYICTYLLNLFKHLCNLIYRYSDTQFLY